MSTNSLKQLETFGQAIWLDYIRRDLFTSGELRRLIEEDGLKGMTSNPSIFHKAITETHDYDQDIQDMAFEGKKAVAIYEAISQADVIRAADEFWPLFEQSNKRDGYVSLEVNPHLAHDTAGTIEEARRLWDAVGRINVMIKVPGTEEGLPAIEQLISEGINVNVTLLFGLPRYEQVAQAYIAGLEKAAWRNMQRTASVASFFLSRIDSLIDPILEGIIAQGGEKAELAQKVVGQTAIASAKIAYQMYKKIFAGERFQKLAEKGGHTQRLLWASTSTKNPNYSDVKYVDALIGPDTINTVPLETLKAYRDHGNPRADTLESNVEEAEQIFRWLPELGIDIRDVTQQLENEGIQKFNEPYDQLIQSIGKFLTPPANS
ncbi:MAG: transaldolase [Candidatus Omnitrophota bacterium]